MRSGGAASHTRYRRRRRRLSRTIGNTTRVIGWYHSHPHITVLPSHVDLRTQQSFQMLDPGFIGVIFSCFDDDANMVGRVQSIAFQSTNGRQRKVSGSFQSSSAQHSSFGFGSNGERSSVDEASSSLSTVVDINYTRRISDSSSNEIEQRLSPGIEEAMHLSSLDMSSGDFSRKEIPMQVVPVSTFNLANPPPDPLLSLQQTVFNEEKAAFEKAMHQSKQGQRIHPLAASHHCVTHQASLLKLMELCLVPAMTTLWDNLQQNKAQIALLHQEEAALGLRFDRQAARKQAGHDGTRWNSERTQQRIPDSDQRVRGNTVQRGYFMKPSRVLFVSVKLENSA
ncbi:hypothetical protein SELMODRAFT_420655 [Selaginella moellendorffii]|uniref:MPN domain-containing protein n=1 Tax=Selaginella moellendorffii TaxID=88036 RepID=D8SCP6_SELML|nr:hypothetical protein SELMODRAFT_420655 [Selaginella moellendorffii]